MTDPSQPLPSARHEAFAQHLADGMTADAAYKAAGFKPHRGNASTLRANQNVEARVRFIMQERHADARKTAYVDTLAEMNKLQRIVDLAIQKGDLATALKGQDLIMQVFGYKDQPTLSQEHLSARRPAEAASAEEKPAASQSRISADVLDFSKSLAALKA